MYLFGGLPLFKKSTDDVIPLYGANGGNCTKISVFKKDGLILKSQI